jgi:hypothetical protein
MRPPDSVHPVITMTVIGRLSRRARVGFFVMRLGAWLVERGGVDVTFARTRP